MYTCYSKNMALYHGRNNQQAYDVTVHKPSESYNMSCTDSLELAKALLSDVYNSSTAERYFEEFTHCVISQLTSSEWQITDDLIRNWVQEKKFQSGRVD